LYAIVGTLVVGSLFAATAEIPTYAKQGHLVQQLKVFDNAEGAIFSGDGKYVFISNSAELGMADKGFHWVHKAGYISKLEVQPDGTLKMLNEKLITGLTAPLGMAVSTVATRKFPRGTIFLVEAWSQPAQANGVELKDPKVLDPKIIAFNPDGKILGSIRIGAGSAAEKKSGVIAVLGNGLAFDNAGNLYLADTGAGTGQFEPRVPATGGGVYLFPVTSLDALANGRDAPLHYLPVPNGGPDGIEVAADGMIHFNTVGLAAGTKDPAEGGMYQVSRADLMAGKLPAPFNRGLGALDGLDFTALNRLDTEIKNTNGILVTPLSGATSYQLVFDKDVKFNGPADIAIRKQGDGSYLMVVPELSGTARNDGKNTVTVIRLPADF
jgi:hypothetical protein